MEKAVASGFAKTFRQNMKHQQVKEIFAGHRSCPRFFAFGMDIAESDHTVLAVEDVLFLDDAFIQVLTKVDESLVAAADFLAVNNPLLRSVGRYSQVPVNDRFHELCPEDLCQCLVTEEVLGRFYPPESGLGVDTRPRHDDYKKKVSA